MRTLSTFVAGLLLVTATAACGSKAPLAPASTPAPLIMAEKPASSFLRPASLAGTASQSLDGSVTTTYPQTGSSNTESGTSAPAAITTGQTGQTGSAPRPATGAASAPAAAPTSKPATVSTPKPVATPVPTSTPRPTATPIPAGWVVATSISARRAEDEDAYIIRVGIMNKSSVDVNSFTFSATWLDGNHPRGGEFGVDAQPNVGLIAPGKTYYWSTTVASTAVTKPLTALALSSTTVGGAEWHVNPGTAPYTVK